MIDERGGGEWGGFASFASGGSAALDRSNLFLTRDLQLSSRALCLSVRLTTTGRGPKLGPSKSPNKFEFVPNAQLEQGGAFGDFGFQLSSVAWA